MVRERCQDFDREKEDAEFLWLSSQKEFGTIVKTRLNALPDPHHLRHLWRVVDQRRDGTVDMALFLVFAVRVGWS